MADKNIQMTQRNATNDGWDNLNPVTKAANVKTASGSDVESQLADMKYQTAGGTATAITLTINETLVNGLPITFIAGFTDSTTSKTINGKPFYKPNTTTSPSTTAGKAYTVWYNLASNCFFIKASAEGNTIPSHVLAGDTFSSDTDTGQVGTAPLKSGITYTPTTSDQTITAGIEDGTCKVKGDANLLASNILSGASIFGVAGSLVLGKKQATGTGSVSSNILSVSGLTFTATFIVITDGTTGWVYDSQLSTFTSQMFSATSFSPNTVTSTSFSIKISKASGSVTWYAYE